MLSSDDDAAADGAPAPWPWRVDDTGSDDVRPKPDADADASKRPATRSVSSIESIFCLPLPLE